MAAIISAVSLWYTRTLVETLSARERKLIDLFAKAYRVIGSSDAPDGQSFLFTEIIETNNSIPVILTDDKGAIVSQRNIAGLDRLSDQERETKLTRELTVMRGQYPPIVIEVPGLRQYIYYRNSDLLERLRYYPILQLAVIGAFSIVAYLMFSNSRRAEQNRVWVGLAKETAHQLGTPLSSLMGWVDFLRTDPAYAEAEFVEEIARDVEKLEIITARFSNIGSVPVLKSEDLVPIVEQMVAYMKPRVSRKVVFVIEKATPTLEAELNRSLFEWVLDNLIRNAVDAMIETNLAGTITLQLGRRADGRAYIDVTDTGKGIAKGAQRRVFDPGFTTKRRGWGLGLTLSKRIMENYHRGKLQLRKSEAGQGTTFRIVV
jgi:signal transduction histidine kinase